MDFKELKRGDFVTFTAKNLIEGNPVEGVFSAQNEDWINIKLLKSCKGQANKWYKNDFKKFKKENISDLKKLIDA